MRNRRLRVSSSLRPLLGGVALLAVGTLAALGVLPPTAGAQRTRLGYTVASSAAQDSVERRLQELVSAASISALHLPLSRRPHPAGSAGSREVIRFLERQLRSFGLEVSSHDYQVWLSSPQTVRVTMTAPLARTLSVREPPVAGDPTANHSALGDGYVAYSGSGDVEGDVVYVNYGLPADYAELERLGVAVRGRIAVARYGKSHRAVKAYTAQEAGARALILYSDPADDGFARGPAWPNGYWRGEHMLQRGNAKLSWFFHGDPLTPGVAATRDAMRLDPATAPTLPHIPVVALAWGEAQHLLKALGGVTAPPSFRGAMPLVYRAGPGPARARVTVRMRDGLQPITNVVATLRGATESNRLVLLGGHHDAWTFGGVDPGTGTAALLEVARVLGHMARDGWRPARTISIAFWDAEEYGLIGSTEYAEQWRRQLQEQLVLYVNTDMYMQGHFDPGGVSSLRDFVVDVARDVPQGNGTVLDGWRAAAGARPQAAAECAPAACEPELKALGSGADFVPFQDHLGVPTLSIEFIGANGYGFGTYHSRYDSRAYVERVADPGFVQGVTMARVLGTLAVRMADADVLPFRFDHYGAQLVDAVATAAGWLRASGLEPASSATDVMRERSEAIQRDAVALHTVVDRRLETDSMSRTTGRALNDLLGRMEQLLTDNDGPTERAWYRHVVHGWNIYSLYDGQPFPGLADAVRRKDSARVATEITRIERALDRLDQALKSARDLLTLP